VLRLGIPIKTFLVARNRSKVDLSFVTQQPDISKTPITAVPRKSNAEELTSLGEAKAKRQDYQGAIANYNQALQINPNDPDAYFRRAIAFNLMENPQAALEDLNQVIRLSPKNTSAYLNRGSVRITLKDYEGAKADGDQAIRLAPTLSAGYFIRGNARYRLKDYEGASEDYDQVILLSTASKNLNTAYASRSELRNQKEDYEGARADGDQVIRLNPQFDIGYLIRGIARYHLKDYQGAIADFSKGIQLNPRNRTFYALRGKLRNQLRDYEGAKADGEQIIKLAPMYSPGYLIRGLARHKLKEYQGAVADFEHVINLGLTPTNVTIAEALRGEKQQRSNNNQVVTDFHKAVYNSSDKANTNVSQNLTPNLLKDYSVAFPSSEKLLALEANPLVAIMHLGLIKYELQDFQGAIREFQAAVHLNDQDPEPQLALAIALYAQGQQKQGLALAQDALQVAYQLADLNYLKENLWGDRLLADTQKMFSNPKTRYFTSSSSGRK
jgi:tetratricopeptide (TPR) repeat protein